MGKAPLPRDLRASAVPGLGFAPAQGPLEEEASWEFGLQTERAFPGVGFLFRSVEKPKGSLGLINPLHDGRRCSGRMPWESCTKIEAGAERIPSPDSGWASASWFWVCKQRGLGERRPSLRSLRSDFLRLCFPPKGALEPEPSAQQ